VLLLLLAACGDDDGSSASDDVCNARTELQSAAQQVRDDLTAGNSGSAKDSMEGVRTAFDNLADAVDDLKAGEKDQLQPQVDQLRTDVSSLSDSETVADARTTFERVQADLQALVDAVREDLSCG
jgi:hypothetical protein